MELYEEPESKLGRKPLSQSNRRSQRVMARVTQEEYLALELAVQQENNIQPVGAPIITTSKYIQMCIQNNKRVQANLVKGRKI